MRMHVPGQRLNVRSDSKSRIQGIRQRRPGGRWQALIRINGKQQSLGTYDTAQQASAAYRRARNEQATVQQEG